MVARGVSLSRYECEYQPELANREKHLHYDAEEKCLTYESNGNVIRQIYLNRYLEEVKFYLITKFHTDQEAIVVLSESVGQVFFINGPSFQFSIPFPISNALAAKGLGIIVQIDTNRAQNSNASIWILSDPVLEWSPIIFKTSQEISLSQNENIRFFTNANDKFLLVTYNDKDILYRLWFLSSEVKKINISHAFTLNQDIQYKKRLASVGSTSSTNFSNACNDFDRWSTCFPQRDSEIWYHYPDQELGKFDLTEYSETILAKCFDGIPYGSESEPDHCTRSPHAMICTFLKTVDNTSSDCKIIQAINDSNLSLCFMDHTNGTISIYVISEADDQVWIKQHSCLKAISADVLPISETVEFLAIITQRGRLVLHDHTTKVLEVDKGPKLSDVRSLRSQKILIVKNNHNKTTMLNFSKIFNDNIFDLKCLRALEETLAVEQYQRLRSGYVWALLEAGFEREFECFLASVFACYVCNGGKNKPEQYTITTNVGPRYILPIIRLAYTCTESIDYTIFSNDLALMFLTLHLCAEDCKLNTSMLHLNEKLIPALAQISIWLDWPQFLSEYKIFNKSFGLIYFDSSKIANTKFPAPAWFPPSILYWLISQLTGSASKFYPDLNNVHRVPPYFVQKEIKIHTKTCERSKSIISIYRDILNQEVDLKTTIHNMLATEFTSRKAIETLPIGLALPILQNLSDAKVFNYCDWNKDELILIGREDLLLNKINTEPEIASIGKSSDFPNSETFIYNVLHADSEKSISFNTSSAYLTSELSWLENGQNSSTAHQMTLRNHIFRHDRRLNEVMRCLQYSEQMTFKVSFSLDDRLQKSEKKTISRQLGLRVPASVIGFGFMKFHTIIPNMIDRIQVRPINLTFKSLPQKITVSIEPSIFNNKDLDWPDFHSGVASGLQIKAKPEMITSSWILYHRDKELTASHAGFLLGLGLNGNLKSMATWSAFNYLVSKHNMTSIGLLLGISASYFGTMDPTITRLLSVHIVALLPAGSTDLNISLTTQISGLLGVGLLYFGSAHRRMSEISLSEIFRTEGFSEESLLPAYTLAAGFSLGFINVGLADQAKGSKDLEITRKLIAYLLALEDRSKHEMGVESCLVAIGLIYLMSNNQDMANKVSMPDTFILLQYLKPSEMLLRVVVKSMILWDSVEPSYKWIAQQFPCCLGFKASYLDEMHNGDRKVDSENFLAIIYIIAGCCFALGLRYAGTANNSVQDLLMSIWDQLNAILILFEEDYVGIQSKKAINSVIGIVSMAAASNLAGTGDLDLLRRLRKTYYTIDNPQVSFGNYLCCSIAMGILFLGEGRFSFSSSKKSIACLFCALFPYIPDSHEQHNKFFLQAFRYLWVLATEPRYIVAYDINTKLPTVCPVVIHMKSGMKYKKEAPCWHPPIDDIEKFTLGGTFDWPLDIHASVYREIQSRDSDRGVALMSEIADTSKPFQLLSINQRNLINSEKALIKSSEEKLRDIIRLSASRDDLLCVKISILFYERRKVKSSETIELMTREFKNELKYFIWQQKCQN